MGLPRSHIHLVLDPSPMLLPSWHSSPWPPLPSVCYPQHPPLPGMGQLWGIPLPGMPTQIIAPSPACTSSAHLSSIHSPGPFVIGALVGCTSVVFGLNIGGITGVKGECLAQRCARVLAGHVLGHVLRCGCWSWRTSCRRSGRSWGSCARSTTSWLEWQRAGRRTVSGASPAPAGQLLPEKVGQDGEALPAIHGSEQVLLQLAQAWG